ncbi:MAG: rRNA maturation RNase YbeY [Gemmatimonadota bacterium]|nr:rRNA maturation RNase YbeY [Gemmatimonadota bacterium]
MKSAPRGLAIDVSSSVRRLLISRTRVKDAAAAALRAEGVRDAMLSITFVGRAAMSELNRRYLRHRGPTDVISFGLGRQGRRGPVVGDIYICTGIARANAKRQHVSSQEELLRLVVHGTLHTLGYDHPEGATRMDSSMWRKQERILARVV